MRSGSASHYLPWWWRRNVTCASQIPVSAFTFADVTLTGAGADSDRFEPARSDTGNLIVGNCYLWFAMAARSKFWRASLNVSSTASANDLVTKQLPPSTQTNKRMNYRYLAPDYRTNDLRQSRWQ